MTALSQADFPGWFRELHEGRDPFPWQTRLLNDLVKHGAWPETISLPTASGKTSIIDIATFHLALQAEQPAGQRTAPLRIFFVVDRRVVVDEAYRHAERLVAKHRDAKEGLLRIVAERLRRLAPGEAPLACAQLRGGIYRHDTWARTPNQPTIVVSTVDQVGSRLLFRGYGLRSGYARPIHAGLVGNDALIVVDEAHTSLPFVETAQAVSRYRTWADRPLASPFALVRMSATLAAGLRHFELDPDPESEDRKHPVLGRRLSAQKLARLVVGKGKARVGPVGVLVKQALALAETARGPGGGPPSIGVIVNRVATARACAERLREHGDTLLLTGRVRPLDRDELLQEWGPRIAADDRRPALPRPAFTVATQCIEVGANLDFDGLVTECASLDALRQRFGRLDRLGVHGQTEARIVLDEESLGQDPVYGAALGETWAWLSTIATDDVVDFGFIGQEGLSRLTPPPLGCLPPPVHAPVLLPAHVDLWGQTSPAPAVEPAPSLYLHGIVPSRPEVMVVWRADLAPQDTGADSLWVDIVGQLPPSSGEAMPVPLPAVRRWLAGELEVDPGDADLEATSGEPLEAERASTSRIALRWRGPEDPRTDLVAADELRPGDLLVVPASYGACDRFGWCPPTTPAEVPGESVRDRAELAHLRGKARAALRVHAATVPDGLDEELSALWSRVAGWTELPVQEDDEDALLALLEGLARRDDSLSIVAQTLRDGLSGSGRTHVVVHASGRGLVLSRRDVLLGVADARDSAGFTDEDSTSAATVRVRLADHCAGVGGRARRFAEAMGLPGELVDCLTLAGELHDLGKADVRFQAWLRGGDLFAALGDGELLAKSERVAESRRELEEQRAKSGYPRGGRHELLSVRLAERLATVRDLSEEARDLVLHLVASHHGRCRPFAPVVADPDAPDEVVVEHRAERVSAPAVTSLEWLDSGVADRFWRLTRRYGWWGLALLETVLRLADHRQSEEEANRKEVRRGRVPAVRA